MENKRLDIDVWNGLCSFEKTAMWYTLNAEERIANYYMLSENDKWDIVNNYGKFKSPDSFYNGDSEEYDLIMARKMAVVK